MAAALVAMVIIVLAICGACALGWFYMEGRIDSDYGGYQNKWSGTAGWLYDLGYNAKEAEEARRRENLARNRQRHREASGK